jgi:hypothetical protein
MSISYFTDLFDLYLQENPSDKDMNQGTLVIFNLEPAVSNEELHKIFGAFGEVREVNLFLLSDSSNHCYFHVNYNFSLLEY